MEPAKQFALRMTVEEYLAMERTSEIKHNYLDGNVFPVYGPVAMAGESGAHADISFNLSGLIYSQLRGTPCRGRMKDTKVRSGKPGPWNPRSTVGMFSYPDVVVICGEVEYHDDHRDVITNPSVIIEVLSPSTELFDRKEKFARYRSWNPTLTDYVLVSQDTT
ncbi:MAG: Uma2 family endonuclease, partial [Fimbriiglobus sp.]